MKKGAFMKCKQCGAQVAVIERAIYRKILVDAEAVPVRVSSKGNEFVRVDGTKVNGIPMEVFEPLKYELDTKEFEYVYRPHKCGGRT